MNKWLYDLNRRPAMNVKNVLLILLTGIFSLVLFSCRPGEKNVVPPKEEGTGGTPVRVVKVERRTLSEKLLFTGTIEPWQKMNIVPDIGGKVARIYAKEGDRVREGQLLAELDTQSLNLQLKQAEAAVAAAKANFEDAKKNKERMDRLFQEKAVSEQQYEKISLAYEAAQAQLEQAQAALNLLRHNLEIAQMKAPFSGVVASKNANEGDVINPMMGSFSPTSGVLTLMDFSRIKINIEVSATDIAKIQRGQRAEVRVPNLPDKAFEGEVYLVTLTADAATKKFKAEIKVDNPDLLLRPGTFGEVRIEVVSRPQTLVIPQRAIIDNQFVFTIADGKAVRKAVELGFQTAEEAEVLSGLSEGDLVIVEGNFGLLDGSPVTLIGEVSK